MALPVIAPPTELLQLAPGVELEVRGLSRTEARYLTTAFKDGSDEGDVDGAEVWMVQTVFGVSEAEATAWREQTASEILDVVLGAILRLSGLAKEGAHDPKADTNAGSSTATSTPTTSSSPSA